MSLVLLDTSAVIAHLFKQSGWDIVDDLLRSREPVAVCAITFFEFRVVLKDRKLRHSEIESVVEVYEELLTDFLAVDSNVVVQALRARESSSNRIPMVDALIAGCAIHNEATLVHRDKHLDAIPAELLKTIRLQG